MSYNKHLIYLSLIPVPSYAMLLSGDLGGVFEYLFLLFIFFPLLAIECIVIIVLLLLRKYKSESILNKTKRIIKITNIIGSLAILSMSISGGKEEYLIFLLIILFSSIFTIYFPNLQNKYYNNQSTKSQHISNE